MGGRFHFMSPVCSVRGRSFRNDGLGRKVILADCHQPRGTNRHITLYFFPAGVTPAKTESPVGSGKSAVWIRLAWHIDAAATITCSKRAKRGRSAASPFCPL